MLAKEAAVILNDKGRKMTIEGEFTGKINTVDASLLNALAEMASFLWFHRSHLAKSLNS